MSKFSVVDSFLVTYFPHYSNFQRGFNKERGLLLSKRRLIGDECLFERGLKREFMVILKGNLVSLLLSFIYSIKFLDKMHNK